MRYKSKLERQTTAVFVLLRQLLKVKFNTPICNIRCGRGADNALANSYVRNLDTSINTVSLKPKRCWRLETRFPSRQQPATHGSPFSCRWPTSRPKKSLGCGRTVLRSASCHYSSANQA